MKPPRWRPSRSSARWIWNGLPPVSSRELSAWIARIPPLATRAMLPSLIYKKRRNQDIYVLKDRSATYDALARYREQLGYIKILLRGDDQDHLARHLVCRGGSGAHEPPLG